MNAEAALELAYRRCAPDWDTSTTAEKVAAFEFFCSNFWYIRVPRKRINLKLTAAQRQTIEVWIGERQSIALKARQIGFSTLAGAYAFWLAFFYDNNQILMISKGEREARKLLAKSRYGYRFLPDWLKLRGPHCEVNLERMVFHNESYIESLPSAADPARGETASLVIVDEMGQLPNSEEAWASLEPVADVGGQIIMLGTANGEGNLFHTLWLGAKGPWGLGTNDFVQIFHSWRGAEHRDDEWYAAQKRKLPEWQLHQEYPDNPEEAFLKSGHSVFDGDVLKRISEDVRDCEWSGFLLERNGKVEARRHGGSLQVWEEPIDGVLYTMGVDVAEGLEHGDYTSIHVINVKSGVVAAHWHGHVDPDLLGSEIAYNLGRWYNNALAFVESNNHGMSTLIALKRARYFPIFRRRRLGNRTEAVTETLGWATTAKTKPKVIDDLNMMLRDGDIQLLDRATLTELRQYRREDGKMHGSPHDDRVMSLSFAAQALHYVHLKEYKPRTAPKPFTMDWFAKHGYIDDIDEPEKRFIGSHNVRAKR